jgi:ArsR family transcriptional regulator
MRSKAESDITYLSSVFDALGSEVRLKIVLLVKETQRPLHIKAVAETLHMDYASVYRHVEILKKRGLVQIFEVGRSRVLSLLHVETLNQLLALAQKMSG